MTKFVTGIVLKLLFSVTPLGKIEFVDPKLNILAFQGAPITFEKVIFLHLKTVSVNKKNTTQIRPGVSLFYILALCTEGKSH